MRFSLLPALLLVAMGCQDVEPDDSKTIDSGTALIDEDGDGYDDTVDCDDDDPAVNPGAQEVCDEQDNDCDALIDEDVLTTFYLDADQDGYGAATSSLDACAAPEGYVTDGTDCDDEDASTWPAAPEICDGADNNCDGTVDEGVLLTFYLDADQDGYGDDGTTTEACSAPSGYAATGLDCDDADADSWPGAVEICDEADNDCDGLADENVTSTFYADVDSDGFGDPGSTAQACTLPTGYTANGEDCDDNNSGVYPAADEICDGLDNDCDALVDEGVTTTFFADSDGDGFGDGGSSVQDCALPGGYASDDTDCDDGDSAINPAATEICDGFDNDCDAVTDEDDASGAATWHLDADNDGYGNAAVTTVSCYLPTGYTANNTDCDDSEAAANPGADEVCDGMDNDCDGTSDEADAMDAQQWLLDADGDGYGDATTAVIACDPPSGYIAVTSGGIDCDDSDGNVHSGATETCNGIDDNCDGTVDEAGASDAVYWYWDADGDGYGDPTRPNRSCYLETGYSASDADCDDSDATLNPDATEICDYLDNNCDGTTDEGVLGTYYFDADGDGFGRPDVTIQDCSIPTNYSASGTDCDDANNHVNIEADEYCNGTDDDCDGVIDEDDALDASTWYQDADADGYGDAAVTTQACEEPSGYTDDNTDCNDEDANTNPIASETCDGLDNDCDGTVDNGVSGTGSACSAEDCSTILADNPSATDGYYTLDSGTVWCDMSTDGGGWTLVGEDAHVYGTGYTGTWYNTGGYTWTEVLFAYASGSVSAHCTYPGSLTGCNNIGFQFGSDNWGVAENWGSSICSLSINYYTSATTYLDMDGDGSSYDFIIARSESSDAIRVGTLEGISACTTSDNSGNAYMDIYVRW